MKALEFISIDAWTIIFQICNLLILFVLVKKFLWKRVMAVLDARQKELDGIYDAAGKDRQDAAQMKEEYTERMSAARDEADRLVRNAVDNAQNRGDAIVKEAQAEEAALAAQVAALEAKNAALAEDIANADDPELIEQIAREELGMVVRDEKVFYHIG